MSPINMSDKMMSVNVRKATALMLLSSMIILFTLGDVLTKIIVSDLTYDRTASRIITKQTSSNALKRPQADVQTLRSSTNTSSVVTKQTLPIYLLQPDTETVTQTTWGTLATQWNRTTEYADVIKLAKLTGSLPQADEGKRPVVMIHCGPKSGSTTLRRACKQNLQRTCGRKSESKAPEGYMNEKTLYPMIRSCTQTNHFCTKETIMPLDVPTFDDVTFIHMFPFRMYDDWAASALKQAFARNGVNGCNKAAEKVEHCIPSDMEIDFRKYGKTDLSKFKELVVPRMNEKNESHIFILYHHRDLNKVLSMLSVVYSIPLLPGSDGGGKSSRPAGTCEESTLQKFHDCFSSQLMELK